MGCWCCVVIWGFCVGVAIRGFGGDWGVGSVIIWGFCVGSQHGDLGDWGVGIVSLFGDFVLGHNTGDLVLGHSSLWVWYCVTILGFGVGSRFGGFVVGSRVDTVFGVRFTVLRVWFV